MVRENANIVCMFSGSHSWGQRLIEEQIYAQSRRRFRHKLCRSWRPQRRPLGTWSIMYIWWHMMYCTDCIRYDIYWLTNACENKTYTPKRLWLNNEYTGNHCLKDADWTNNFAYQGLVFLIALHCWPFSYNKNMPKLFKCFSLWGAMFWNVASRC